MASNIFEQGIRTLEQTGFADVILPFFLVFVIAFAVLQNIKPFEGSSADNKQKSTARKINVIIALVMGAAVIFPHVTQPGSKYDVVPIMNKALPQVSLVIIGIVAAFLVLGMFTSKVQSDSAGGLTTALTVISIGVIIYIFAWAAGLVNTRLPHWLQSQETMAIIVTLAVFWLVLWFIMKPEKPNKAEKPAPNPAPKPAEPDTGG